MKFCFIIPPQPELARPTSYISLGVGYLAAVLEQHKHDVCVHDMNKDGDVLPPADIYGITCVSATFRAVRKLAWDLTMMSETVIVGGVHPSAQPDDFADVNCYVVIGEAEHTLPQLIEIKDKPKIIGAWPVDDIDNLPFPARHLFKNVVDYSGIHGQPEGVGATSILSSRGCPYSCTFCTSIPQTRKMRYHSPDYMLEEIMAVIEDYPAVRHFRFVDDIFALNKDRVMAFCDKLIAAKLGITWVCITRASTLDQELLAKMRAAGCIETHIGVESGSQRILNLMNKKTDVSALANGVQMIKQAGIRAKTYLMYGFPGETDEDRQMTINFVGRAKPDMVTVSHFTPMPGSKMWDHRALTSEQWFYQDEDEAYQEFRKRVHEAMEGKGEKL